MTDDKPNHGFYNGCWEVDVFKDHKWVKDGEHLKKKKVLTFRDPTLPAKHDDYEPSQWTNIIGVELHITKTGKEQYRVWYYWPNNSGPFPWSVPDHMNEHVLDILDIAVPIPEDECDDEPPEGVTLKDGDTSFIHTQHTIVYVEYEKVKRDRYRKEIQWISVEEG